MLVQNYASVTSCNARKDYLDIAIKFELGQSSTPLPGLEPFGRKSSTPSLGHELEDAIVRLPNLKSNLQLLELKCQLFLIEKNINLNG